MKTDQIKSKEMRTEIISRLLTGGHLANIDVHGKPVDLQLQKIHVYDGDFHGLNDYSKIISHNWIGQFGNAGNHKRKAFLIMQIHLNANQNHIQ